MYERLRSPGKIGGLTIPNRVVMTAASACLSEPDGRMTEEMLAYYARRARGGVGLIITEMVCVDEAHGVLFPRELNAARDGNIPAFRCLADRVHPYGTKIFAQLFHPGSNGDPALNPGGLISAEPGTGQHRGTARAATGAEIRAVAEAFGQAALRVKQAGFDGVEVHAAHHYFLHLFLSPATNHRTDEFGGSLENRARPIKLILEAVRKTCGPDFPIMVRVSVEEYIGKDGYHADTGIKVCQLLERWGADAVNVSASGTVSRLSQSVEPMNFPQGWRKHLAKAVRQTVGIPVCCVSVIRDPDFAEELLEKGYTDFVGSVRSHLADPDWAVKAFSGRAEEITRCISCMSCFQEFSGIGHISCALNPETGYETIRPGWKEDGAERLVVVLGAGPGGLEAAYDAALRGFRVKLFEKADAPGGQLRLSLLLPRKEKMAWLIDDFTRRCQRAGVEFRFGHAPTADELRALAPYAILDATGGGPLIPPSIKGARESPLVCTPADVISGRIDVREESVVVVGSGMTGLETAELLCDRERNNAVLVLEAAAKIAPGTYGSNRNAVTAVLDINNVVFLLNRTLTKIGSDRIWFRDSVTGEEYVYPCDRVVLALGTRSRRPYGDTLDGLCPHVLPIGDALRPGRIWQAVHGAYEAVERL